MAVSGLDYPCNSAGCGVTPFKEGSMSLAIVHSRAQVGVQAPTVTVEAHLANGLPALTLVGLPETAVKESKDRVRSAILNAGFDFPARRITIKRKLLGIFYQTQSHIAEQRFNRPKTLKIFDQSAKGTGIASVSSGTTPQLKSCNLQVVMAH